MNASSGAVVNSLGTIDLLLEWLSIAIAGITGVLACYLAVAIYRWFERLRFSRTSLAPFVFGVAIYQGALLFWVINNLFNTILLDDPMPLATLPARLAWFAAAIILARFMSRLDSVIGPAPPAETDAKVEGLVLFVEDNDALARVYRRTLDAVGINAEFAQTGEAALTVLEIDVIPVLMVVDLGLPDMNGVEVVRRARALGYTGPAVALSGAALLADPARLGSTFVEVVEKPIRPADLVALVQRWSTPDTKNPGG